jgi:hypothetical protein
VKGATDLCHAASVASWGGFGIESLGRASRFIARFIGEALLKIKHGILGRSYPTT